MPLTHELNLAIHLARVAGNVALTQQTTLTVSHKPLGEGPVTDADQACDDLICAGIAAQFPSDLLVSEESFAHQTVPMAHRIWFIDPIDGTADYVRGGEDYCVMIGLAIDGIPALGVVYQPTTHTLWQGINLPHHRSATYTTADGVTIPLRVDALTEHQPLRATISRNHPSKLADFLVSHLGTSRLIPKGSMGLKLALIAQAQADFYIAGSRRIKLWDTCAPSAILQAAGGIVTSLEGLPLVYSGDIAHRVPILATTPTCEQRIREPIQAALAIWKQTSPS